MSQGQRFTSRFSFSYCAKHVKIVLVHRKHFDMKRRIGLNKRNKLLQVQGFVL